MKNQIENHLVKIKSELKNGIESIKIHSQTDVLFEFKSHWGAELGMIRERENPGIYLSLIGLGINNETVWETLNSDWDLFFEPMKEILKKITNDSDIGLYQFELEMIKSNEFKEGFYRFEIRLLGKV